MSLWNAWMFQNLLSNTSSFLESFHDLVMVWLMVVLMLVMVVSYKTMSSVKGALVMDSEALEITWTVIPILILLSVAYPSIFLLCLQDFFKLSPMETVKMVSNQWNWQSDSSTMEDHLLDSEELDVLSSYEAPLLMSINSLRVMLVSTDVLHSLGVPSLGLKLDATPGRMNTTLLEVESPGLVLGSCYELCGSGHSAMPINFIFV